jgi:copper chaperone CopZ
MCDICAMENREFIISGMTCGGCVARAKKAFESLEGVQEAQVQLEAPQATLSLDNSCTLEELQTALNAAGPYTLSAVKPAVVASTSAPAPSISSKERSFFETYKPLLLIVGLLLLVTGAIQWGSWNAMEWMRHFMAGFFLVFSFFKLLNVKGFAESYRMYDWIAGAWPTWGYIYPFVELALGMAYLVDFQPFATNGITFVLMTLGAGSVIQSNVSKRKIQCACLGDVFKLPMSFVTIVEDGAMALMAGWMLLS